MRRARATSLVLIVVIAAAALAGTLIADNEPQLGLDLQGGASVVLEPKGRASGDAVDQAIEIIRNRVDGLGVAEPNIARQGNAVVVELPGVRDQRRALQVVGRTAELRFRPVVQQLPPGFGTSDDPTRDCGAETTPVEQDNADRPVVFPGRDEDGDGRSDACYQLGPVPKDSEGLRLTGRQVSRAKAEIPQNQWIVTLDLRSKGKDLFNDLASQCFNSQPTCPSRQIAITLDGRVESAPQVQTANFDTGIQISGGGDLGFRQREAKDLALVLRYGALPVQLEPQTVQTVSATLGRDSLRAGLFAGLGGVALVALYIILYYRALGIVVILGLGVWSALNYSIISYLGANSGLALSLAGVTGIVVSVGVTVDSYIVYFERLKDEIRAGKTIRSAVDRGFRRAFRTILAADTASFIGAALLYWLTVGPVRGFAFFLGLSTLLDVVVAYVFTRPLVALLGRSRFFTEARWVGVARAVGAFRPAAPAVAGGGG